MEEHEVFDSSLLKETINQLIGTGKRNFAIDMSPMDYIYSDTINMLMALNRRVLDVTGRLSLMAPQPEVLQILKRAGIHNVLRVFETETDLIKSSEDMIIQTSSHRMSDIDAAKSAPPESEFDQLRSEIGSVFDSDVGHGSHPQAPAHHGYSKPAQEDDFDQMFQQFEGGQNKAPAFGSGPQTPKFQPRQFTQPPSQPMPLHPSAPVQPQKPQETPQFSDDFSSVRPETQRFTTAPVPPAQPPVYQPSTPSPAASGGNEDIFEAAPPKNKPSKAPKMREDFDNLSDDFEDEFKKKSPLPAILIVILILALGGAGAFVIYLATSKKKPQQIATIEKPAVPKPAAPQLPVATPDTAKPEVKDTVATPEPEEKEIVTPKPQVKKPPVRRSTPRRKPVVRRRSSPPPATSKPQTVNKVELSSSPSGAVLQINGKRMGTTPFTWKTPFFGKVTVTLTKTGYEDLKESFKFTGGSIQKSFSMKKAVSPPPTRSTVQKTTPTRPSVASTPRRTPPPPAPVDDEEDPFADIGDEEDLDFGDEPASSPPAVSKPSTPAAPPVSRPSTPAASGGQASIFIASIPPVADVYLGDKLIGKTNVSELKIPAGVQTLKFVKGAKQITKQLTLKPGKNPSQMVRIP